MDFDWSIVNIQKTPLVEKCVCAAEVDIENIKISIDHASSPEFMLSVDWWKTMSTRAQRSCA